MKQSSISKNMYIFTNKNICMFLLMEFYTNIFGDIFVVIFFGGRGHLVAFDSGVLLREIYEPELIFAVDLILPLNTLDIKLKHTVTS